MSLINLELENEQIINDYFKDLCCDNYTIPFLLGGQSNADNALNQLNINKYATKKKQRISKRFKRFILFIPLYTTWST